jgi:hypothetical protein
MGNAEEEEEVEKKTIEALVRSVRHFFFFGCCGD